MMSETRQKALVKGTEEKIYQIEKMEPGDHRPLVIAITSKTSAQRLIAALCEQHTQAQYRVRVFLHPFIPGLEKAGLER
jgi:hypothetical protein